MRSRIAPPAHLGRVILGASATDLTAIDGVVDAVVFDEFTASSGGRGGLLRVRTALRRLGDVAATGRTGDERTFRFRTTHIDEESSMTARNGVGRERRGTGLEP